jgi:mRNA interferase RelE/StbE
MKWRTVLAWLIRFEEAAEKELAKLDKQVARRIIKFLRERVAVAEDPRTVGAALRGARLGEFWKYRVRDYRIIASIEDGQFTVLVLRIGNRREIYR